MAILLGKVYQLESEFTEQVYVGSTSQELDERFNDHNDKWKCWQANAASAQWYSAFELMQHPDVKITLLEDVYGDTIAELRQREQHHIDENDSVNMNKAFRTPEDLAAWHQAWQKLNRDKQKLANEKWRKANPEKAKAATAKWRSEHQAEIKQKYLEDYDTATNNAKCAKYRAAHKDQINKYKREQYEKKKDEMLAKTMCGCGGSFDSTHRSRHLKSVRHIRWAETQKDE